MVQIHDCSKALSVKKQMAYGKNEDQCYPLFVITHAAENTHDNCPVKPYINDKRIRQNIIKAVKDILTNKEMAHKYIDSDFDEDELQKLQLEIKRLTKQEQTIHEKIDRLLDLKLLH